MTFKLPKFKNIQKGFTLIELLVVIAIIGILAIGLIAVIDPVDKINAGNDSKVKSDVIQVSKAAEAYAVSHNGVYPAALDSASFGGELRSVPAGLTYAQVGGGTSFAVFGTLRAKANLNGGAAAYFRYDSTVGKSCILPNTTTYCN